MTCDNIIPSNFAEKSQIYLRISKAISDIRKNFPVDLIVHTKPMHSEFIKKNSVFARELLENGKVIYEKNN